MELNLRPPALRARIETGAATEGIDVLSNEELASGTDPIPANREVNGRREAAHERRGAPFPAVVARETDVGVAGGLAVPRRRGNARLYSGSLGSLAATLALPPAAWLAGAPATVVAVAGGTAVLILFRHRANLRRLRAGTERRMTRRRPPADPAC